MAIILIRTLIIFLALIVAMRLMGKRQLGELELSELVVAVLIADIASIPLQNPSRHRGGTSRRLLYHLVITKISRVPCGVNRLHANSFTNPDKRVTFDTFVEK